jgi:hypothetical protein
LNEYFFEYGSKGARLKHFIDGVILNLEIKVKSVINKENIERVSTNSAIN